ncbi:MAG: hypothetical protein ACT452_16560 [Microthrixaceae bacterium]
MSRPNYRPLLAVTLAFALMAAACGGSDTGSSGARQRDDAIAAQVASYDLVAGRTGRFIVGIYGSDRTRTVAYGTVTFQFAPVNDRAADPTKPGPEVEATFLPIPGQALDPNQPGPRLVGAAEATGVYGAPEVTFDQPGFWEVTVHATLDGNEETTTAAFEVLANSPIPTIGDRAPRTVQPLAGSTDIDPKAIDSRASADRPVPDPELHSITIADALDASRPFMVVVSTPTFCTSRFCGPITDSVQQLAKDFADMPMAFIHLEVWQDFENNIVNPPAREWIAPTPDVDGAEPWVFVVDANGTITHRFDNVATDAELRAATEATLAE